MPKKSNGQASGHPNAARSKASKWDADPLKRQYRKNFLTRVVARCDFSSEKPVAIDKPPSLFTAAQKKTFSIQEVEILTQQHVEIEQKTPLNSQTKTNITQEPLFHYWDKLREKKITVARQHMSIEFHKYTNFQTLIRDFIPPLKKYMRREDDRLKRIGLRYIDEVILDEPSPTSWNKYLSEKILCAFRVAEDPATLSRVFNVTEFAYGDFIMRFQYGMPNPDYPAPIHRKHFVLDFDAYAGGEGKGGDMEIGAVEELLLRFHDKIKQSFEEVIMDGLREQMDKK